MQGSAVGQMLRTWRKRRRYSQLELAEHAEVSARHLSYLENGRSMPSREMVLVLASALKVPLADRNRLLLAAGFAPAYRSEGLASADAIPVDRALRFLLRRHQPYPAVVVDPGWNAQMANVAYLRLAAFLGGQPPPPGCPEDVVTDPPLRGSNTLVPIFDPGQLRPLVVEFERVAPIMLAHVESMAKDDETARKTLRQLLAFGPPTAHAQLSVPVVVPLTFVLGGQRLSLFSTMTMLGTATDTLLASLRLETLFPANDASDGALRAIAAGDWSESGLLTTEH